MRHRKKGATLDRKKGPREALLKSLAQHVLIYEGIQTTCAKAKAVRPLVERYISHARSSSLVNRRYLLERLSHEMVVRKLLEVIGPRYKGRQGGYTRIIPLGPRKGDYASIVRLELV